MESPLFTLDIGSSKVALLVSQIDDDGVLQALDVTVVPNKGVQRGVVTDLEATASAISDAMSSCRQFGQPTEVTVNVNGSHIEGSNAQGFVPIIPKNRSINSEDVLHVINHSRQVVPTPDREQLMALPREYRVDGQRGVKRPIGMSGNRLEVMTHIVTGQIAAIHNIERAVEMAGYRVSQMVASPFAAGLALLTDEERETGCAVVDLGAGTTSVSVFTQGTLAATACIPLGGATISGDLAKLLKMTPEEAEKLKKSHGRAVAGKLKEDSTVEVRQIGQNEPRHMQRKVLYEIIECRAREIAEFVRDQVERSGLRNMLPGGIVITGGGSHLPGIPQLFAQVLKESNVRVASPTVEGPAGPRSGNPELSGMVGLALYAWQMSSDEVQPASGFDHWKERIFSFFQLKV